MMVDTKLSFLIWDFPNIYSTSGTLTNAGVIYILLCRIASEACNEGEGSHWASSAFHINDATKHKCGPKSIGKHKAASECGRPPKSKIQKITESHQEGPIASSNFLRMPGPLLPGSTDFHISESLSDFGISDSEFNYSEDIWQEGDYLEFLPDQDDSELPGIEELEPLSDFTDIG